MPEPANPAVGLTVQQADALWDAVAIPGPHPPTFPEQHKRVCRAVAEILAELPAAAVPATGQTAPIDWIDGHPQLEAIAAGVWEQCRTEDTSTVVDDPRNIAVAALAAVLGVPSAGSKDTTTTRADVLREAADRFDRHAEQILVGVGELAVFVAKARRDQVAVWREAAETLRRLAAETQPSEPAAAPVHVGGGANAEDCPACKGATPPPYPWTCPSPDAASAGVQTDEETNHG